MNISILANVMTQKLKTEDKTYFAKTAVLKVMVLRNDAMKDPSGIVVDSLEVLCYCKNP